MNLSARKYAQLVLEQEEIKVLQNFICSFYSFLSMVIS